MMHGRTVNSLMPALESQAHLVPVPYLKRLVSPYKEKLIKLLHRPTGAVRVITLLTLGSWVNNADMPCIT